MLNKLSGLEGFDWDEGNRTKNWQKHHVTIPECEQVFFNEPLVVTEDAKHSTEEERHFVLGKTDVGRFLFLVFTVRKQRIRVISARDMSAKERSRYHEQTEEDAQIQE